jgi:chromosome segregation ATPase
MKTASETLNENAAFVLHWSESNHDCVIKAMDDYAKEYAANQESRADLWKQSFDEKVKLLVSERLHSGQLEAEIERLKEESDKWHKNWLKLTEAVDGLQAEIETHRGQIVDRDLELKEVKEKLTEYENQWQPSKQEQIDALNETVKRLESDVEDAVSLLNCVYHNVDQYHLNIYHMGGELYDHIKDYIGE